MPKILKKRDKLVAAKKAVTFLEKFIAAKKFYKPLILGIGSGTTMALFVILLGKSTLKNKIKVMPSSSQIEKEIRKVGLKITKGKPFIAIDGADEITPKGILKGHGALAFVKEKQIDYESEEVIFVVDKSKFSKKFTKPILVEIKKDAEDKIIEKLSNLNLFIIKKVRHNNNTVLFLSYKKQFNPKILEKKLNNITCVTGNGIFTFKKKPIIITN